MVIRNQRMQSLILEILQAQPSLKDSKTYLSAFGPKRGTPNSAGQASSRRPNPASSLHASSISANSADLARSHASTPPPPPFTNNRKGKRKVVTQYQSSAGKNVSEPLEQDKRSPPSAPISPAEGLTKAASVVQATGADAQEDPSLRAEEQPPDPSAQPSQQDAEAVAQHELPVASSDQTPHNQQHVALVKIQGPFTSRQLASIAEGMVYLKRLGLVSIIVVDNEDWHPSSTSPDAHSSARKGQARRELARAAEDEVSRFDKDGKLVSSSREREEAEFRAWASSRHLSPEESHKHPAYPRLQGQGQESLRKRMISQTHKVAELLTSFGSQARPFPHAMMCVDAQGAKESHKELLDALSTPSPNASSSPTTMISKQDLEERSPLVADDQLHALRSALMADQIPVLAPLALWNDSETGAVRTVSVSADDLLVNLAREMSLEGVRSAVSEEVEEIDLTPVRLMMINREGGIPSHARGGSPHLSINLASEYSMIQQSFIWDKTHPTATRNLATVRACLAYMPQTSSGIVISHRSPRSLIANLIKNKAAHSPSLPHRLLASRKDVRHTPTIIRSGLSVKVLYDFDSIDWDKMVALLEASFGRTLDRQNYIQRVKSSLDFVIVTGDYEGAAIVTKEFAPSDDRDVAEPIAYLDKFAMLPSLQGSGAVDFLWGALRDEVHGLGLLDALNDNGGKGGFGDGRDLVWKSRSNNPVNRWYYERSNGFVKIDTRPEADILNSEPQLNWSLFWCDAEERLARMAGEIRLGASARPEDVMDLVDEEEEARYLSSLPAEKADSPLLSSGRFPSRVIMAAALAAAGQGAQTTRSPFQRDLAELSNPIQMEGGGTSLLPVVAPDEEGRIQRWAECMRTIPSAWL